LTIFKKIWTLPNFLSLLRLILAPLIGHLLYWNYSKYAIIVIIIAYFTDAIDGTIARKFNQQSELGKVLDPLADKVMYAFIALALLLKGELPLWFAIMYVVRDLLLLLGGLVLTRKVKSVPQSDLLGKVTAAIIALSLLGLIFKVQIINPYFLVLGLILSYLSAFNYYNKNLKVYNKS
jgi:CDP-diacylglycerol--glycerol-3-phosphate 3-phosphatidyltransferase